MRINPFPPFRQFIREVAILWLTMGILAVTISSLSNSSFGDSLAYSLSIGSAIYLLSRALEGLRGRSSADWKTAIIAIPTGTAIGVLIAAQIAGDDLLKVFAEHPNHLVFTLAISLIFGTGFSYYFYSRQAIAEASAALKEEALARVQNEQRMVEADLRMLQAQIEPHFLFNTLSNVLSLIRDEPQKAERMLSDLTDYLRVALQRTRTDRVTLGDELLLLQAYLGIQQVRMGDRLRFTIEVDDETRALGLPPLIIQPLAENAVRHGLEPLPLGGNISVKASRIGDRLGIEIADTGQGIADNALPGVGIANVRARLQGIYGDLAHFVLLPNTPHGVTIRIEIPIETEIVQT